MAQIEDGGPVFPVWEINGQGQQQMTWTGLSLRDWFAGQAMKALLSSTEPGWGSYEVFRANTARAAYEYADEMLKARAALRALTGDER